ncbi:MAG: methylated-DNA--[protein]-cysteine S-methyltransferase [Bacteroidetes bacterium]|nr:methylated-DNA--[protein]-cysteine S-methyltransferase [Bacteroidota bacterium]
MKAFFHSPLGCLEISSNGDKITSLYFNQELSPQGEVTGIMKECFTELDQYFKGERKTFTVDIDLEGTEFQKKVWMELMKIPFGDTISYLELSKRVGDIKSVRAVGNANGKNPVSIIVPCHRVIGSNGKMIGYGGGLWRKRWLLEFERTHTRKDLFSE